MSSTAYEVMPQIFHDRIRDTDVLVEVGCGKGRVINWWLHRGLHNNIIGLEIMENVARQTSQRLRKYSNVTIICGDAIENLPTAGTLFYAFNPFGSRAVVEKFKSHLFNIFIKNRDCRLIYGNGFSSGLILL